GKVFEVTLGANPTSIELATTGPTPMASYLSFDYDPINQTIGGMIGQSTGGEFFAFKPATREWKRWMIAAEGGGVPAMAFHSGKFEPSGCYIALSGMPTNMTWAVRPPAQ